MDKKQNQPSAPKRRRYSSGQAHYISRSVLLEELGPPGGASSLVVLASSIVLGFIVWASLTSVAETSKALGEIVPGPSVTQVTWRAALSRTSVFPKASWCSKAIS